MLTSELRKRYCMGDTKGLSDFGEYLCKHKVRFTDLKAAWRSALWFFQMHGWVQHPYRCPHGVKHFHLTGKHSSKGISVPSWWVDEFNEWFGIPVL